MPFLISGLTIGQATTVTFVLHGDSGTDGLFLTGALGLAPERLSGAVVGAGLLGLGLLLRRQTAA